MIYVINVTPAMWSAWCDLSWHRMWSHHGSWLPFTGPVPEIECGRCGGTGIAEDGPREGLCQRCGGFGNDHDGFSCRSCRGTGGPVQLDPRQECSDCQRTGMRPVDRVALATCVCAVAERENCRGGHGRTCIVGSATVAEIVPILDAERLHPNPPSPCIFATAPTEWPDDLWLSRRAVGDIDLLHLLPLADWSDKAECQECRGGYESGCTFCHGRGTQPRFAMRLTDARPSLEVLLAGSEFEEWFPQQVTAPDTDQLWEMP